MNNKRTILTYTGKVFDFWEPTPDMFCIEDIAHALAIQNRYNGHTTQPYSVAEHCVRMSFTEDGLPGDPLTNLLHDAAEAYVGDVASPQKRYLVYVVGQESQSFAAQEESILRLIHRALGLDRLPFTGELTRGADLIMLATEVRDLMPPTTLFDDYLAGAKPLVNEIYPWEWFRAEQEFLNRFSQLTR